MWKQICLYLFVCSLTFLSSSFRILGGRNLSTFFSQSELLSNPVVGVMIGILVTVRKWNVVTLVWRGSNLSSFVAFYCPCIGLNGPPDVGGRHSIAAKKEKSLPRQMCVMLFFSYKLQFCHNKSVLL